MPVRDQDRALDFCTDVLGFRVLTDQPFDDHQRWIERGLAGTGTNLVLFMPEGQEDRIGGFSNATFWTDDVKGAYAR